MVQDGVAIAVYHVMRWRQGRPRRVAMSLAALVALCGVVVAAAAPHIDLPDQLWRSLPFLLALVVLAGAVTTAHMPSKLTLPYSRGED